MFQLMLLGDEIYRLNVSTGDTWVLTGTNWTKLT